MEQTNTNLFDLQIDAQSQSFLSETAKWTKFVAIMHFIFVAIMLFSFMLLGVLAASTPIPESNIQMYGAGVLITVAIILTIVVVVPNIYLLRFSIKMQSALRHNDQPSLISAFINIKSCYKFLGITYIVFAAIWVFSIVYDAFG